MQKIQMWKIQWLLSELYPSLIPIKDRKRDLTSKYNECRFLTVTMSIHHHLLRQFKGTLPQYISYEKCGLYCNGEQISHLMFPDELRWLSWLTLMIGRPCTNRMYWRKSWSIRVASRTRTDYCAVSSSSTRTQCRRATRRHPSFYANMVL